MRRAMLLLLMLVLVAPACGGRGDLLGQEQNQPDMRVAGWKKVDLDPDHELTQPFILAPEAGSELLEPSLIRIDGRYVCYYERLDLSSHGIALRSKILAIESRDILHWTPLNGGAPVLAPDADWELTFVGAPSVIRNGDQYVMYYAAGSGAGIGVATSANGLQWEKNLVPVLTPDQKWEDGLVAAPSALVLDGRIHLWYSGGAGADNMISWRAGKAIGRASSDDGLVFTKEANPVLVASEDWENCGGDEPLTCRVASPSVIVRETTDRRILQMFYTGGEPGELGHGDASIGLASSTDGIHWEKADGTLNPVVQELFPLQLPGAEDVITYDEYGPTVLQESSRSLMVFSQLDALNWLAYKLKGLALATNPAMD